MGEEATVYRGRMSTEQKVQMPEDPTGQGAARWSKGRRQGLTDDPWKETKPRSGMAPGPREAGRADARQVRSPDSHLWHSRWLQPELQAFPSHIKINSEAIKMTSHGLPAEPRTKVGSGSGLGRA